MRVRRVDEAWFIKPSAYPVKHGVDGLAAHHNGLDKTVPTAQSGRSARWTKKSTTETDQTGLANEEDA